MADKSRSLSFFLFICALLSGVIFYGCGSGGGTSSDSVPLQISGNITSIAPLSGLRADSALNPALLGAASLAGIEVYIESARESYSTTTDIDGKFLLSGIPAGSHFLVARVITATHTLKVRSAAAIIVTESRPTVQAQSMALLSATASASGRLLDVNGNPVQNGRLLLWGEEFFTDNNGYYLTPAIPPNVTAPVIVAVPGYQSTEIEVKFTDNPPFIEQTIVNTASTNRPPTSSVTASRYTVSPGVSISLAATATDPDETLDTDNFFWSATIGTFSGSLYGPNASWIAPNESVLATITCTVTDSGGLKSSSSVQIVVGSGIYVPNNPPTISSITSNSTDGNYYGTLAYDLIASATDIDGDKLTYSWTATSSVNAGTLSGSGEKATWRTPDVNASTSVIITVTVTDGKGGTASLPTTFTVVNDPDLASNRKPDVPVIRMPDIGQLFNPGERATFSGSADDPDEGALGASAFTWSLKHQDVASYELLGAGSASFSYILPTTSGTYTVKLQAADKYQATNSATLDFRINAPPGSPMIGNPANNQTFQIGSPITFTGAATDVEDGSIPASSLTWLFPAPIGVLTGASIATDTLPEGNHTIQLSAKDSKGAISATATVRITVTNTGPTMTIASPANGSSVLKGASTTITGNGMGLDGEPVEASTMVWDLWSTGVATATIASGTSSFPKSFDTVGSYVITLTGKDGAGKASSTRSLFYVNEIPSVIITEPESGKRYDSGTPITFAADLTDSPGEEPFLIASWASSLDGHFGFGVPPLEYSNLSSGSHVITCEVINTRSHLSTSTSTMILVNTLPVATITYSTVPYTMGADGRPVFMSEQPSTPVSFTVTSFDKEINGTVESYNNDNVKWFRTYEKIETQVGTGAAIVDSLPVGISTITVKLYDSFYPAFADQASNSTSLQVQVWQSRSFGYGTTPGFLPNAVDISGTPGELTLTFNTVDPDPEPSRGSVRVFKYHEGLGVDYFELSDTGKYHTATSPLVLSVASSAFKLSSTMVVLGATSAPASRILRYEAVASFTPNPHPLAPALTAPTNITSDGTRLYICDIGTNAIMLMNPSNFEITNVVYEANDKPFVDPLRVRYSAKDYGKVFIVDYGNDRIVRYGSEVLGTALRPILIADPIDVGFSKSYMLVMDSSRIVHVIDPNTGTTVMTFGGTGTTAGKFNIPISIYCSGSDLFVLESNRIQVIRSGVSDWLKE